MTKSLTMGLGALLLVGCASGAVMDSPSAEAQTRSSQKATKVTGITAADRQQGAQAHPQLMTEFGGAMTGTQANYVRGVGQRIAVQSGLSNAQSDFTVTLLNSPVHNAFAIPGGYVYVTRQLMALMNNEAELAGVLGHEVGHVAARHSKKRQSAATRNTIFGVLGSVLGGAIGDNGGVLGALGGLLQNNSMRAAQLATLGFSRSQELEADQLGVRYLASAGYDPMALSTMLASLANQTTLETRLAGQDARALPEWASTHPDPAGRVRNAQTLASRSGKTGGLTNADPFLNSINGVLYGDDPREGVVEGRSFIHPDLRLRFTVPAGFAMQNSSRAVSIAGQSGQGEFSMAPFTGDLDAYIAGVFRAVGGQQQQLTPGAIQRTTVNGIPAAYSTARVQGQSGQMDITVFAYAFANDRAYHFVTATQAGSASAFQPMFASMARLSASEAAAVRPRKVSVVTVRRGDTVASLASRMAYTNAQTERFLVLNRLTAGQALPVGKRVKIVTY